jgi:hypothetical protein
MEDSEPKYRPSGSSEMPEGKKTKGSEDAEEVREILSVVSEKVPALIKGLMSSVFSADSARDMGKAAATYYSELKAGGIPDDVAVQMTKEYIGTFSKISDFIKTASRGQGGRDDEDMGSIGREINVAVKKRLRKELKHHFGKDEDDEEDTEKD